MKRSVPSRLLSWLLILTMLFSMVPVSALAAEESVTATLVTDVTALAVGDQVVIVAAGSDYALSTNQKSNNRGAAAITKADGTITLTDEVQILTLAAGTVDGTFAFNTDSGYLYAAGQSKAQNGSKNYNYLRTQTTLDANGSWKIEISSDGTASIVAQGDNGCNVMQYNSSSTLFAAYSSASQAAVAIYAVNTDGGNSEDPDPEEPTTEPTDAPSEPEVTEGTTYVLTDTLAAGDVVVLYNAGNSAAVSSTASGYKLAGVSITPVEDVITTEDKTLAWTVGINEDGTYTFTQGEMVLGMVQSGTYINLSTNAADGYTAWTLESSATDKVFYLKNTNMPEGSYGPYYLEYYSGFTAYASSSPADAAFGISFYKEGTPPTTDPETPTDPTDPPAPEPEVSYADKMTALPNNGDTIIIYNSGNAMGSAASGKKLTGIAAEVTDDKLPIAEGMAQLLVTIDDAGNYIFTLDGAYLTSAETGNGLSFAAELTDCGKWTITAATDGTWYIKNVGANYNGNYNQALEYYSGFTTYGIKETEIYQMQLFLVAAAEPEVPAEPEVSYADKMTALPNNGDTIIIYNSGNAMGAAASGKKLTGIAAEVTDGKLPIAEEMAQLLVTIDDAGNYIFTLDGAYLTSAETGNGLSFAAELTDCGKWTMEEATDGTWYIKNVGANYNGNYNQAMEYYSGFTTYGIKETEIYQMQLFLVASAPAASSKVTSAEDFTTGTYVMVVDGGYAMGVLDGTWVSVVQPTIEGDVVTDAMGGIWTLTVNGTNVQITDSNGATIKPKGGNNNGISSGSYDWAWSFDEATQTFTFAGTGSDTVKLASNASEDATYGGFHRFRGYKNTTISGNPSTYPCNFTLYRVEAPSAPESDLPTAGDQVVIYNLSAQGVLAAENDTQSIENAAAEIVDGKAVPANGGVVFTVEVNGTYYRFYNETYGYLCSNGTGNNAFYSLEASEDADWTLTSGKSGGYNMESRTAKYNGTYSQYLEYYADAYKTYSMYNVTDYDIYEFFFYEVAEGVNLTGGIVNDPTVDFGTLYDAYVGADYTFSFTVDAVFGIEGDLTVKVGETDLTANEDGTYTIPAELVSGESLTITVEGKDTKGVAISGSATVTVKDEPVIGEVTPAANTETKEDKKPVISAEIANAGEDAVITMTVNGEEVEAVYENGILTYTPAEDMADGRTSVTVTVTRADGKTAEKTWAFTVGEAQYQLYFGQLHSHTTYSDGSGSLDSALSYIASLPESANVDFVAFTDHSNYFDASGAANPEGALYDMTLGTANSQKLWDEYVSAMKAFNARQGNVIAIPGFEMTWSGGPGHINTFNTPGIVSRNNTTLNNKTADAGMKAYYALLSQAAGAGSISQFNHPGSTFGTFSDFAYWDAVIDTRIQLVEVGNGEGQIGAGGYYPSYEYYTMALDKGWHVAPTNNQDNHKGKWGNANDARDVIITDDFSEEGIYAAIRAMRMYATEDKNLEITYTLNGKMLGSIIEEVPESLTIDVTVYDPDASDSISKVELIVNSGKVAYTWSDPSDLADGALTATLTPDYSYYYVRVTEGDGDLAVTAPVWVGESLKLGISSVECGTSTPVTYEELTITTTLFNSENNEAIIKSMTYSVDGKVIETVDNPGTIPASGTLSVDYKYTPDSAKVQKVTVLAVVDLDGKEYTFTMDITLDVQDASKLVYIGIDASHYNEYVNGNYKDSMGNFSELAAGYNIRTVTLKTSEDLIAACSNEKYKALILTAPSRRSAEAQASDPLKVYTAEELAAITEFNANGGIVILAGWSDHYENYPDVASIAGMKAEEHMAATQNAVLEALGSSLRIGDDATYDDEFNGGQAYRLYFNTYGTGFLTEGVEVDPEHPHDRMYTEVFSHYGGASVYTVDGTLPTTVSPVVFGHSGTYSVDVDKDGLGGSSMPKYEVAAGDSRLMIMATEQLEGRGLIIVSGAAFMSNFEVQATIEDSGSEKNYSNYRICENLCAVINPVQATPIAEVRAQTEAGYKYTIEGIVTSNASGYDKDTAFFDCIYVQDATGGICCFPVAGNYKIGDKVRITGTTEFYQGEPELQVTSIEVIGEGTVEATEITASELNDRSAEGKLVTISGTVESFELANGLVQTIMVKDAEGNVARIFIDGYITTAEDVKDLAVGAKITATGLASYDDTFNAPEGPFPRIRIRNRADVICTIHEHSYEIVETVDPTCTEDGHITRVCECGDDITEIIPATGHSYESVVTDPTCTEDGYTTYTCACGDTYVDDYVDAHGHNVVLKESKEPTCEQNGYEYYACEHCGGEEYQIILEATGHDYEDGKCTACGEEDPDADKPGTGSWIGSLIGKWFDKWFGGNDEPTTPPTQPEEPSEPEKPSKPGFGSIFDWIFWWR